VDPASPAEKENPVDLDALRADLEQVVRESEATIVALNAEETDEDGDIVEDEAAEAADFTENDREEAMIDAAEARRTEALEALARMDAGSYGVCVECGTQIPEARLQFRPEAARCVADQEKFEENEGQLSR
jgi:RNA polymerase-binding transcription factor DksA